MSGGADFTRLKEWLTDEEILTNEDLNNEFNNFLDNLDPDGIGDHSDTVAEMKQTTDPGEVGSESQATNLAGELERLRFLIREITGKTEWYESPIATLAELNTLLNSISGIPDNRIVSGRIRSASNNQPVFLVPDGATNEVDIKGAVTPFVYRIEGALFTIITDVTISGLVSAPSANNTALVNDAGFSDQEFTKEAGERGSNITIDNVGTEISNLVGKFAAFKINDGISDEFFTAFVESATTLTQARRGFFFDSADSPVPRLAIADGDTITILKSHWIYANIALNAVAVNTNPVYSGTEPTSPAIGDRWFDQVNKKWKRWTGSAHVDSDEHLVGLTLTDSAGNCIAARSFDFFASYNDLSTVKLIRESISVMRMKDYGSRISIAGNNYSYDNNTLRWDITADLDSGVSEAASTIFYLYIKDTGVPVISDLAPYQRRDLLGEYHPFAPWRCVGYAQNNSSSDFTWFYAFLQKHVFVSYSHNAGLSIPNNVTTTVDFEDIIEDENSLVTVGSSWQAEMPAKGYLETDSHVQSDAFSTVSTWQFTIKVGATVIHNTITILGDVSAGWALGQKTKIVVNKGDIVFLQLTQNTGATRTLTTIGTRNFVNMLFTPKEVI